MEILYMVVPCYNEQDVLPHASAMMADKLSALADEGLIAPESRILFVDDGSSDGTWELISRLHEASVRYAGIRLRENHGQQNALMTGLMAVRDLADITVTMDADLQDDINAIGPMVEKHLAGADIVCGVRNSRESDAFLKRVTARGYYRLMGLFGAKLIFDHADFRLMDRKALYALARYHSEDVFLRGVITRLGLATEIVEYPRSPRAAGESKYTLKKMLALAASGTRCSKLPVYDAPRSQSEYIAEMLMD